MLSEVSACLHEARVSVCVCSYLCVAIFMCGTFGAETIPESLVLHTVLGTQEASSKYLLSEHVYGFLYIF